jgi:hypothetical protein
MIEPVRHHVKMVWCNNIDANFKWMENWFAFIMQNYPKKTNAIVQITGDEGTGKSCVFEWLCRKVFGELCIVLSGCEKLTRSFNAHLIGKVIVCLEEICGDKQDAQRIKHIATSATIDIERKGIDVESDVNAINIICFSNSDNPMPPVVGINRRLVHFKSNPIYVRDTAYFKRLLKFLNDDENAPIAFFHYYRNFEIDYNCLFNEKPITDEKNYNRFMSLQEVDRAVYFIIVVHDRPVEVTAKEMVTICKRKWSESKISPIIVGRRLTSLGFSKRLLHGYYQYNIDKAKFSSYDSALAELCREFNMDDSEPIGNIGGAFQYDGPV